MHPTPRPSDPHEASTEGLVGKLSPRRREVLELVAKRAVPGDFGFSVDGQLVASCFARRPSTGPSRDRR